MSVNKVHLLGRLGQDPEIRMTQAGKQVCTLSLATSEVWMKDGHKQEKTQWHRVILWDKMGENAGKYLKKGREVYIEGKIEYRTWEDTNGQKRYSTEIIAEDMKFIGGGGGNGNGGGNSGGGGGQRQQSNNRGGDEFGVDDDVPF